MYNRYIRSEAGEVPFSSNFIPVSHMTRDYLEETGQREDVMNQEESISNELTDGVGTFEGNAGSFAEVQETFKQDRLESQSRESTAACAVHNAKPDTDKKTGSILGNLLDLKKINADTLIVLGIALFILCDSKDDTGDVLLILAMLLLLGF